MTKHDFKEVLDGHERGSDNGDLTTWLRCYEKDIVAALKIADRLQSGNLSEDMISLAYSKKQTAFQSGHTNCNFFKAMSKQLIKEIEDE